MNRNVRKQEKDAIILALLVLAVVFFAWMCQGCYQGHGPQPVAEEPPVEVAPETVSCESPTCYLFHYHIPYPRGVMHACEACTTTEAEIQARQVELGCSLTSAHDACTLIGACEYSVLWDRWAEIRSTTSCERLSELAQEDPCVRPDPMNYWRADQVGGGCQ